MTHPYLLSSAAAREDLHQTIMPSARLSPIRVMHVVYSLEPGGMEHGVVKLVNAGDRSVISNAICATRPGGALRTRVHGDVPVYELNRRKGNDPRLVRDLYRLLRRTRPHVVHTHAWGTLLEGLVAARLANVPVIVHGEHGTLQLKPHQRWFQRAAWARATRVLSVSSRLAERISRETGFPLDKIHVIRNGVDLSRFGRIERNAARSTLRIPEDRPVAVAVGRLVPVKDHGLLLDALALARRQTDVILMIAGEGPLHAALRQHATRLGLENAVTFLGQRSDVEMVLGAADVFVQSSSSEGLSNTVLEAMASRLPVIATQVGGTDEMVEHGTTGVLVPPQQATALGTAIQGVVSAPDRGRAMGLAGRSRVEQNFNLEGMIRRYEDLYRQLTTELVC